MGSLKDTLLGTKPKTEYMKPQIMDQTADSKALQNQLMQWNYDSGGDINAIRDHARSSLDRVPQFDFGKMWDNNMGEQKGITHGFADLARGKLLDGYEDRTTGQISKGLSDALGSRFAQLASRGVANSSTANSQYGQIQTQAADAFDRNYQSHLSTSAQMLGEQEKSLWNSYDKAQEGQKIGLAVPASYYEMMSGLMQPSLNMWNSMENNRYAMSTPGTYVQHAGTQGILGPLIGAGINYLAAGKKP